MAAASENKNLLKVITDDDKNYIEVQLDNFPIPAAVHDLYHDLNLKSYDVTQNPDASVGSRLHITLVYGNDPKDFAEVYRIVQDAKLTAADVVCDPAPLVYKPPHGKGKTLT